MKKFRYFLELRVVKTTTTKKTKLEFFTAHKNKKQNKIVTH